MTVDRHVSALHVALVAEFLLRAACEGEQQLVDELVDSQVTHSQIALNCIDNWTSTLRGARVDLAQLTGLLGDLDAEPAERAVDVITGLQGPPSVRSLVPILFDEFGDDQRAVTLVALAIVAGYHRDRRAGAA